MTTMVYPEDTQYGQHEGNGFDSSALDVDEAINDELSTPGANTSAPSHQDADTEDDGAEDSTSRSTKGGSKPNNRNQFRRVAQKALEVDAASDTARTLAASVLGCASAPAELTAYIMTAPRQSTSPLADIAQVAEEIVNNPLLAGITPASWESPRLRAVWAVLHGLGAVNSPSAPASSAKAASAVLTAVAGFAEDDKTELASAAELLKRS